MFELKLALGLFSAFCGMLFGHIKTFFLQWREKYFAASINIFRVRRIRTLYNRQCRLVGRSVGRSVGWLVGPPLYLENKAHPEGMSGTIRRAFAWRAP